MLRGNAFLALWNDIERSREPEYDRWHTIEHVPERVAIRGFHGARRYVNRARAHHRYFTLYEVEDLSVFEHAEYADVVAHPTPWSLSMRPDFRNFLRAPCRLVGSDGEGIGAALAILCFEQAGAGAPADALSAVRAHSGVTGCHIGEGTGGGPANRWSTASADSVPLRGFDRVMLIEALDRDAAAAALEAVRPLQGVDATASDFGSDVYDLAFVFPGHAPDERQPHRRAQWDRRST
jgi:hypothetical protein